MPKERKDSQIAASKEHEGLHKEIGRAFDKENQTRAFPKVYSTPEKAREAAADKLQQDFEKAQKHDARFQEIMKKESYR